MSSFRILTVAGLVMATTSPAFAHSGHGDLGSLASGFVHPLFGLDHVIAMIAVGLWAATQARTALTAMPCAFLAAMVAGYGLALTGVRLPMAEPMMLASVIALGTLVALAVKVDLRIAVGTVALFGLFHGHAHGGELGDAGALTFGIGFVVATVLLQLVGIGLGVGIRRSAIAASLIGAATATGGLILAFA